MNRADMIEMVANRAGVPATQADHLLTALFESIEMALVCGETVMIRRFGKFEPRARQAARRRNPRTGEIMEIPPMVSVGFVPSINLRARLNAET